MNAGLFLLGQPGVCVPSRGLVRFGRLVVPGVVRGRPVRSSIQKKNFSTSSSEKPSSSSSFLGSMLSWYARKLETHPITTKSITSGIIAGAGDFICQCLVDKPAKEHQHELDEQAGKPVPDETPLWWWNAARTGNFLLLGGAMVGPALHYWYGALATRFPLVEGAKTSAAAVKAILSRVALDQFLFTPLFVPCWIAALWTLDGANEGQALQDTVDSMPQRMRDTLPDIIVANWMLWWPVQCVNFWITPVQFQVLASNCVALLWNAYLSFSTRPQAAVKAPEEVEKVLVRRRSAR